VLFLREIAGASSRLDALVFGAEDLAGDMGAQRTAEGWEVFYARSAVVTTAKAYGLQAIDMVFIDLQDVGALEMECRFARRMGYDGKMAIHPRQVEVMHQVFRPSEEEVAWALHIIRSFESHQSKGSGVFDLDGKMVDMPMVRAAKNTLRKAEAAGLLPRSSGPLRPLRDG
jgi:citrate lyase subunit beta-like protein